MDQTSKAAFKLCKTFLLDTEWAERFARPVDMLDYGLAILAFVSWCRIRRLMHGDQRIVMVTDFAQADVLQFMDEYAVTPALHENDLTKRPIELRLVLLGLHDFGAWLVENGHLRCNPFAGMPRVTSASRNAVAVAV